MNAEETDRTWRVGELATETGLTVRTLHHYHAIGLLVPSTHHDGAHRRYTEADVRRLHHILALRGFGLSLAEIGQLLDGTGSDPRELIQRQLDQLNERIVRAYRLRHTLLGVLGALDRSVEPPASKLIELIEVMTAMESPLTPEQFAEMSENRRKAAEQLSADQLAEMARRRQQMAERLSPDELAEMQRRRAALVPHRGDEPTA